MHILFKLNKLKIVPFCIFYLFYQCDCDWKFDEKDLEFSQKELCILGNYEMNDTIYFHSNLGDIDTITIMNISEAKEKGSKCFISLPPYYSKNIEIKHLPLDRWTGTTCEEGGEWKTTYQTLISVTKFPLKKETDFFLVFKSFVASGLFIFGDFKKKHIVSGQTLLNCYKITHSYPERIIKTDDIEFVYWSFKNGLSAYSSKSGETWFLRE